MVKSIGYKKGGAGILGSNGSGRNSSQNHGRVSGFQWKFNLDGSDMRKLSPKEIFVRCLISRSPMTAFCRTVSEDVALDL